MPDFRDWEKRAPRPLFEDDEVDDLYDEDEDDDDGDKAPLVLRIVAWISVLVLLFAGGYWGTSLTLKYLDKKQIIGQHNVVSDPDEARRVAEDTSDPTGTLQLEDRVSRCSSPGEMFLKGRRSPLSPGSLRMMSRPSSPVFWRP